MILFINTAGAEKIFLAVIDMAGKVLERKCLLAKYRQAESLLVGIEKILFRKKYKLEDIKGIIVVKGPGSFTALRIGVDSANTLALALNAPVVGVMDGAMNDIIAQGMKKLAKSKKSRYVLPEYGMEPKIGARLR